MAQRTDDDFGGVLDHCVDKTTDKVEKLEIRTLPPRP